MNIITYTHRIVNTQECRRANLIDKARLLCYTEIQNIYRKGEPDMSVAVAIALVIVPLLVVVAVVALVIILTQKKNNTAINGNAVNMNYSADNQQPPVYQPHIGGYRAPISKRELATCIILSLVTCGIYGIVWMINLVDDLNTASQSQGDQNGVTVFLLSLVTCGIYSYIWLYKAGEKVNVIKRLNGEAPDTSASLIYLILGVFGLGIVSYCLIQDQLNKVAAY